LKFKESTDQIEDDQASDKSFEVLVAENASWVLDASQLRDMLFEVADLKVKHKLNQAKIMKKLERARKQRMADAKR
jgi:hypothetical protein